MNFGFRRLRWERLLASLLVFASLGLVYVFKFKDSQPRTETIVEQKKLATIQNGSIDVPEWGVKIGVGEYGKSIQVSQPSYRDQDNSFLQITISQEFDKCGAPVVVNRTNNGSQFLPSSIGTSVKMVNGYFYSFDAIGDCAASPSVVNGTTISREEIINKIIELGLSEI